MAPRPPFRIGLISDTHGYFDPAISHHFADVDRILHAGDICSRKVMTRLEELAPLTAVLGNNDFEPDLRDTEVVKLGGSKILIHHIVDPERPLPELDKALTRIRPDIVIFGHTHQFYDQMVRGIRFINPGYSGRKRFNQPRSLAILEGNNSLLELRRIELD